MLAPVVTGVDADRGTHVATTGTDPRAYVGAPEVILGASASAHVGMGRELDDAIVRSEAKAALTGLGWKPTIAHAAVVAAAAAQNAGVSLERLIFEALRRCPVPKA